jgi:ketosteroid isomerase-like protein
MSLSTDTDTDLWRRVRRIEDRQAIEDLAVRYCVAIDDRDYDALLRMYTEDATLGTAVGAQAVVDTLRSIRDTYGRTIHTPEAHAVTFAGDGEATGLVLSHAELDIADTTVHTAIRYVDRYRRAADGSWRFVNRTLKVAYALPFGEMAESMTAALPVRWPGTDPAPGQTR